MEKEEQKGWLQWFLYNYVSEVTQMVSQMHGNEIQQTQTTLRSHLPIKFLVLF